MPVYIVAESAADTVLEICFILREQQQNANVQEQVEIASLLNRICLIVEPLKSKTSMIAA